MKAMILAAGFGTRLRPLTYIKPKPLFPVLNRPLVSVIIEQLLRAGATEVGINTHHLGDQIAAFLVSGHEMAANLHLFHEQEILGTGGGLRNAKSLFNDGPFLVINGDILTTIDLKAAYQFHVASGNASTMVLHNCSRYSNVMLEEDGAVKGFSRRNDGQMAFTGVHVFNPDIFSFIPKSGYYDILDAYRAMIAKGLKVGAYTVSGHYWTDMGTKEAYLSLHCDLLKNRPEGLSELFPNCSPFYLGRDCRLSEGAQLIGWVCMGKEVKVGANARIARSVIWDGVSIKEGAQISDEVLCGSV